MAATLMSSDPLTMRWPQLERRPDIACHIRFFSKARSDGKLTAMPAPVPTEETATQGRPLSRAVIIAVLAASAAFAGFAITSQSYWIDEASSLIVAMAPNPSLAWKYAEMAGGSAIQMPLYHVYLYVWHKIFGGAEWAMRASNVPWFLFAQLGFLIMLRERPKLALTACLLATVSPTVWIYLDETRPYLMQFAASCWLVAAIARLCLPRVDAALPNANASPHSSADDLSGTDSSKRFLLAAAGFAFLVLFGSSLLGAVWAAGFLVAFAWLWFSSSDPTSLKLKPFAPAVSVFLVISGLLIGYYAWTWPMADGGYYRADSSFLNLAYIAYDFLGFAGYGPGKLQLRSSALNSIVRSLPALLPLAAIIAALVVFALSQMNRRSLGRRIFVAWTIALLVPSILVLFKLLVGSYRGLPQHFIPAFPAVVLALASVICAAFAQKQIAWRAAAALLPLLWLGSALDMRWRDVHAKDDYRTATKIAASALAENKEVWWAADAATAFIYLTPIGLEEAPGRAWAMQAPSWDSIRYKYPPRVIVISKPDIYDPQGAVARYAAENQFSPVVKLQAFTIFTRHGEPIMQARPSLLKR